jgi:hypothetical protein
VEKHRSCRPGADRAFENRSEPGSNRDLAPPPAELSGAFERYRQAVTPAQVAGLLAGQSAFSRHGVLSAWVVIWLIIFQRLHPKGTLASAVRELWTGPVRASVRWKNPAQPGGLSANTSAYSQARSRLPEKVAEQVSDLIFESLAEQPKTVPDLTIRLFLLDGSSLLLQHSPELVQSYPPAENRYGTSHWPIMRVLVAHDVVTGLAVRPCSGPMYGPAAVSEQGLAKEMLARLPAGSAVLGDRNFGIFSIAYHSQENHHPCLVRLTQVRARKLNGGRVPHTGTDKSIGWEPSRWELKNNPEIPDDASVQGRLIAVRIAGGRKKDKLFFFTTLDLPSERILTLYGYRWNIETDLRSLKQEVRLYMLDAQSEAMVRKELVLGVSAYNLTRGAMNQAATALGMEARQLSFSLAQDTLNAFLPALARATSDAERQALTQEMLWVFSYSKLTPRKRAPFPREVWGRPGTFPKRKASQKRSTGKNKAGKNGPLTSSRKGKAVEINKRGATKNKA